MMYYYSSSDSSDSENHVESTVLDFSYLLLDSPSLSQHLQNSIREQNEERESNPEQATSHLGARRRTTRSQSQMLTETVTRKLHLHHNSMAALPFEITQFTSLRLLNVSNNNLTALNDFLPTLVHLEYLIAKNNDLQDDGIPKDIIEMKNLKEVNLCNNRLTMIPPIFYEVSNLKYLSLGDNQITEISPQIQALSKLEVLNLGGNLLTCVPDELGSLPKLGLLSLCQNKIRRLPRAISRLTSLKSLFLHKNNLCCLPVEIVKLESLAEISLRDNPLVAKFVSCCAKEILLTPPTLMELAARIIRLNNLKFGEADIPRILQRYLNSGQKCVNPMCRGMYFTSCVEHIKFVDFCGMYRVPLMHYLCSSKCSTTPAYSNEQESSDPSVNLQRVLLG